MHGTVKKHDLRVITIFQQESIFFVIIFKPNPNKCGNTENISKSGIVCPKNDLISHGAAVTLCSSNHWNETIRTRPNLVLSTMNRYRSSIAYMHRGYIMVNTHTITSKVITIP